MKIPVILLIVFGAMAFICFQLDARIEKKGNRNTTALTAGIIFAGAFGMIGFTLLYVVTLALVTGSIF